MALATMKLFLLFPLLLLATMAYASSSSPSVIIVGAGMSGISAANTLEEAGIKDFLILEATNRIGGRIHKMNFAGYTVEIGANWLHGVGGPQKNPLYEMAKTINLKSFYSDFDTILHYAYKQEGGMYNFSEVDAALDKIEKIIADGGKFSKALRAEGNDYNDMSILAFERLAKLVPKTKLEKVVEFFDIDGEQSESARVSSLKHVLPFAEDTYYGEDSFFVADSRGFESLVHLVAKNYLSYDSNDVVSDPRIKFNQVVTSIDQSSDGGVTVTTEDGAEYKANAVIVSASVGVLQSDLISFKPELPLWKRRAIAEFSLGVYTKVFLKFPHAFWPTGNGTEFFLYAHERKGYYGYWQHLENEYPGSNILFVTLVDDESRRVEPKPDEDTKAEAMEVLRKMFGKDIPDATDIYIPRWNSNRFYKGSFSNWPVGYSQERHRQLRSPVGQVYFTGEHTHPRLFGYADGAYYSGIITARDVIKCLKKNKCPSKSFGFDAKIRDVVTASYE